VGQKDRKMARYINEIDLPDGFSHEDIVATSTDRERVLEAFLTGDWTGIGEDLEDEHGRQVRVA
jgi:hypothetical protein